MHLEPSAKSTLSPNWPNTISLPIFDRKGYYVIEDFGVYSIRSYLSVMLSYKKKHIERALKWGSAKIYQKEVIDVYHVYMFQANLAGDTHVKGHIFLL